MNDSKLAKAAMAFAAIPYYLLFSSVTEPNRTASFLKNVFRFFRSESLYHRDRSKVPTVEAAELFPALFDVPVEMIHSAGQAGSLTCYETYVLCSLVRTFRPHILFEFGTFEGKTTLQLAVNAPSKALIYTLDLPAESSQTLFPQAYPEEATARHTGVGAYFSSHPAAAKIVQLWGDSASYDFNALEGKVNFIFIDGDHGCEYVKRDSENAFRMLADPGVVVWHDYDGSWSGVTQYLRELARSTKLYHIRETSFVMCARFHDQQTARSKFDDFAAARTL